MKRTMIYILISVIPVMLHAQRTHERAPQPGVYKSSMMTSWLTITPKTDANPSRSKYKTVDYGVGSSVPIQGLFGDLILNKDGSYTLTKDTHGGTWDYNAAKDSVIFTGWLATFKTGYERKNDYIIIYTGDVKMPDGGTLNIRYYKDSK